jgi:hypothetical protein
MAKRFIESHPRFVTEQHQFEGTGKRLEPVADCANVTFLIVAVRTNRSNSATQEYTSWLLKVLAGDSGLIDTIEANAELAEDPTSFHSAMVTSKKMKIVCQIEARNRPVVYLRYNPKTYEVVKVHSPPCMS